MKPQKPKGAYDIGLFGFFFESFKLNEGSLRLDSSDEFIHHGRKYYGENFNFKIKELFLGLYL
jgi:hypothetical protein